jgi:FkbM family methyltransferase
MTLSVTTVELLDELFGSFLLKPGDIVWLVGGHQGLQVQFLLDTYPDILIEVYEPQPEWSEFLKKRFLGYPVRVHAYALGDVSGNFLAGLQDTDCTFHWKRLQKEGLIEGPTSILKMEEVCQEYYLNSCKPTLLMMNCEGSELEIIKQLNKCKFIREIPYILTQFHSRVLGVEGCQEAYDILEETHSIHWRYNEWSWVYAVKKEN